MKLLREYESNYMCRTYPGNIMILMFFMKVIQ